MLINFKNRHKATAQKFQHMFFEVFMQNFKKGQKLWGWMRLAVFRLFSYPPYLATSSGVCLPPPF